MIAKLQKLKPEVLPLISWLESKDQLDNYTIQEILSCVDDLATHIIDWVYDFVSLPARKLARSIAYVGPGAREECPELLELLDCGIVITCENGYKVIDESKEMLKNKFLFLDDKRG